MKGRLPHTTLFLKKYITKGLKIIKQISKKGIQTLLDAGYLKNTHKGYVNRRGYQVGYYKTCGGKRYIEDWYVNQLEELK